MNEVMPVLDYIKEIADLLRSIDARLASQSSGVSSVEVHTSTRGHDIAVKVYAGSEVTSAGDAAVAEYFRVAREIEKRLMGEIAA